MKWKKIDKNIWENVLSEKFDFVITKEHNQYVLDIFDSRIENNSKAYIHSFGFPTFKEAKHNAGCYI